MTYLKLKNDLIIKYDKLSQGYRNYNEDGILVYKNLVLVMDGATTLLKDQSSDDFSIASKLVDYAIREIPSLYDRLNDVEAVFNALSINAYRDFGFKSKMPAELPSMGLACVIIEDKLVKLYLLGDLGISIKRKSGRTERFIDNSLNKLDGELIALLKTGKKRDDILDKIIYNRNLLGKEYQAFIPSENPNFKFKTKNIKTNSLSKLLIYSDGYYSIRDTFKIVSNHQEFINLNINKALELIKAAAYQDAAMQKYPRLKVIDDISVIKLKFKY